jgi:hypothetical protein
VKGAQVSAQKEFEVVILFGITDPKLHSLEDLILEPGIRRDLVLGHVGIIFLEDFDAGELKKPQREFLNPLKSS